MLLPPYRHEFHRTFISFEEKEKLFRQIASLLNSLKDTLFLKPHIFKTKFLRGKLDYMKISIYETFLLLLLLFLYLIYLKEINSYIKQLTLYVYHEIMLQ